jgi:hypothetical protein
LASSRDESVGEEIARLFEERFGDPEDRAWRLVKVELARIADDVIGERVARGE